MNQCVHILRVRKDRSTDVVLRQQQGDGEEVLIDARSLSPSGLRCPALQLHRREKARTAAGHRPGSTRPYLPLGLLEPTFWVSAEAATDFTAAGVRGLLSSLEAVVATRAEVVSLVDCFVVKDGDYQ